MVSTMSADLVSLPLLHEPKVPHRSACLDGLLLGTNLASLFTRSRAQRSCINETTAQSRDCAVAA